MKCPQKLTVVRQFCAYKEGSFSKHLNDCREHRTFTNEPVAGVFHTTLEQKPPKQILLIVLKNQHTETVYAYPVRVSASEEQPAKLLWVAAASRM